MRSHGWRVVVIALSGPVFIGASSASAQICDEAALDAALAAASPGDTVRIGACVVEGNGFLVPDGVTLAGQGFLRSAVRSTPGFVTLGMTAGAIGTALEDLTVDSSNPFAVRTLGSGSVRIENVLVTVERGVGIASEDAASVVLDDVAVIGSVIPGSMPPPGPDGFTILNSSTHGIVLVDVGSASFEDVVTSLFANTGVLTIDTDVSWDGGGALLNSGGGAVFWGGHSELENLHFSFNAGPHEHPESIGAAFLTGASVVSDDLHVHGNGGWGLHHAFMTSAEHEDLRATGNDFTAVWIQSSEALQLDGAQLNANDYAGVHASDTDLVTLIDTTINGTRTAQLFGDHPHTGPEPDVHVGDGIHLIRTAGTFDGVRLQGNQRAGFFAELGALTAADLAFTGVSVSGGRSALGAVTQSSGIPQPLITGGIVRRGRTASNDSAWVIGGIGLSFTAATPEPCFLPLAEMVASLGLAGLMDQQHPPN